MNGKIRHSGVIDSIAEGVVKVRILQQSACAACKVAGYCHASESKEKLVDISCDNAAAYHLGQEVVVSASQQVAFRAVLLGFGAPLFILVVVLAVVLRLTGSEVTAAISAMGSLVLYYAVLWLLRGQIGRRVSFEIEELKK